MLAKRGFIRRLADWARARGRCDFMREVVARPESPKRCTLPITAVRVTPPSRPAIWLALSPSAHSFFKSATRSSFQAMPWFLPCAQRGNPARLAQIPAYSGRAWKDDRARKGARERQQPDRPTINARLILTLNLEVLTRTAQRARTQRCATTRTCRPTRPSLVTASDLSSAAAEDYYGVNGHLKAAPS